MPREIRDNFKSVEWNATWINSRRPWVCFYLQRVTWISKQCLQSVEYLSPTPLMNSWLLFVFSRSWCTHLNEEHTIIWTFPAKYFLRGKTNVNDPIEAYIFTLTLKSVKNRKLISQEGIVTVNRCVHWTLWQQRSFIHQEIHSLYWNNLIPIVNLIGLNLPKHRRWKYQNIKTTLAFESYSLDLGSIRRNPGAPVRRLYGFKYGQFKERHGLKLFGL